LCTWVDYFVFMGMVIIEKGEASTIFIALFDKRETSSNTYTFLFQHEVTKEEVTLSLADVSEHKDRYSEFNILEASFQNSTVGFWRYYVTQTGSGADIIATGKMELTAVNLSTAGVVRYNGYNGNYKTYTV
jgi:hypothetical protein